MKHQWLAYVIVVFLSIGAGVAIAGLPNNVPVDATISAPTTTEAPASTVPTTTVPATPATTEPETTEPDTTVPETTEPDTTEPEPTDSVPTEAPERSEIIVGAANGAGIAGTAARAVIRLEALGYTDVVPLDGTEVVEFTAIYFADGFELAALQMADDLDVFVDFVLPLSEAPSVESLPGDIEVLAYIGVDRAG